MENKNIELSIKKIELLAPAGSLASLKAAIAGGADAVYLGMKQFGARAYATNFSKEYLKDAVKLCRSNNVKVYLTMNTLVKNTELQHFFDLLSYAYSVGIDAVIIQDPSFIEIIKKNFPKLKIHISTQAGVMNSNHANLFNLADRINLARELSKENIKAIRKNFEKEIEIFVQGALCVCISGSCLFSSFLGGRSGNRGKCAQPCRKKYNEIYTLSTKDLCLIEKIPEIIDLGINSLKIEGRMRSPYYVFTASKAYREVLDLCYSNPSLSKIDDKLINGLIIKLQGAFSRGFSQGNYSSMDVFNKNNPSGKQEQQEKEDYEAVTKDISIEKRFGIFKVGQLPLKSSLKKQLLVKVYNKKDAIAAYESGADIIYLDLFDKEFLELKKVIGDKLYAATPRMIFDSDLTIIKKRLQEINPKGIMAGNLGTLKIAKDCNISDIYLDYNANSFNDLNVDYFNQLNITPIISPELSIKELSGFKNKNFCVLVHGKIILMTLAHKIKEGILIDEKEFKFFVNPIRNGVEITNEKELGLFNKAKNLLKSGINQFYIDSDKNVEEIVKIYRQILDGKTIDVSKIKNDYVLGWSNKGVE